MTSVEEAVAAARRSAQAIRARGGYAVDRRGVELGAPDRAADWRLSEWAIIEPDPAQIHSTRRFGAPLTLLKRALVRFLRQYNDQVLAQQSRFNAHVAAHVLALEDRVAALEERLHSQDTASAPRGADSPVTQSPPR